MPSDSISLTHIWKYNHPPNIYKAICSKLDDQSTNNRVYAFYGLNDGIRRRDLSEVVRIRWGHECGSTMNGNNSLIKATRELRSGPPGEVILRSELTATQKRALIRTWSAGVLISDFEPLENWKKYISVVYKALSLWYFFIATLTKTMPSDKQCCCLYKQQETCGGAAIKINTFTCAPWAIIYNLFFCEVWSKVLSFESWCRLTHQKISQRCASWIVFSSRKQVYIMIL